MRFTQEPMVHISSCRVGASQSRLFYVVSALLLCLYVGLLLYVSRGAPHTPPKFPGSTIPPWDRRRWSRFHAKTFDEMTPDYDLRRGNIWVKYLHETLTKMLLQSLQKCTSCNDRRYALQQTFQGFAWYNAHANVSCNLSSNKIVIQHPLKQPHAICPCKAICTTFFLCN